MKTNIYINSVSTIMVTSGGLEEVESMKCFILWTGGTKTLE